MEVALLLKGIVLGLSIAVPVGPIAVLCIRRTLAEGWATGVATGLGAATADALYGTATALGLAVIAKAASDHSTWLRLFGGAFLTYLGLSTFRATPVSSSASAAGQGRWRAYASGLLLTLSNPMTILSFAAIFAGLGVADAAQGPAAAGWVVLGTFLGSASWWWVLATGVHRLRGKLNLRSLFWLNRVSGAVLMAFGLSTLASSLQMR